MDEANLTARERFRRAYREDQLLKERQLELDRIFKNQFSDERNIYAGVSLHENPYAEIPLPPGYATGINANYVVGVGKKTKLRGISKSYEYFK